MQGTIITPSSVNEIKQAVDNGHSVYHGNTLYEVQKDSLGQYLIVCASNGYAVGLTWRDGKTLNGKLEEFTIVELKESEK